MNKNIAIIFDDLTEFFVLRSVIDEMLKQKLLVDIIVPFDSGYNGLAEHTFNKIKELGYKPIKDAPRGKSYKVFITPYQGLEIAKRTKYDYHLRLPYSVVSAKPNPVYNILSDYDGILFFNKYEPKILSAYGSDCYTVPCWKYYNFKKQKNKKPHLLILPTFGDDISCLNSLSESLINELKEHFVVMLKVHHAIHFGSDTEKKQEELASMVDEFYTSDVPIVTLLEKADVVLSDNSGSIFEAIYSGTPVASFSKNLNSRHLGNIDTLQYQIAKDGILPYTSDAKKVLPMLLSIQEYYKKQSSLREDLFIIPDKNSIGKTVDIIKSYLVRDSSKDYHKILHNMLIAENKRKIKAAELQISTLSEEKAQLEEYKKQAELVFNSRSYRYFNKIINFKKKLTDGKKYVKK